MQNLSILIGSSESFFGELIEAFLKVELQGSYDVHCLTCKYSDEVLEQAAQYDFDLFVLFVNSMAACPPQSGHCRNHIDEAIALIPQLKSTYQKPVIAFSGFSARGFNYRLEAAGADIILPLPFDLKNFADLLEPCLN